MTSARTRFAGPQRFLHWFTAACILAMLFIGIGMVSTVAPKYLKLVQIHKPLGVAILVLVLVRLMLRIYYGAPALPTDLPMPIKLAAELSQYVLYALMIGMPLIGWGMLSASSHPVKLFDGANLPAILPVNATAYSLLRRAHYLLAFAFFVLILMHVAALLFHKLIRKDGVFDTMAPFTARKAVDPATKEQEQLEGGFK